MKNYKYIVFTRFDTHSASQYDKDWLQYRLNIFKKYTLQSLLNQEYKDFAVWIRYCEDFKEDVKEFNNYLRTLQIKFLFTYFKNGIDYETDDLYDYVKDSELVIETRIDSDDMYHKSALKEVISQTLSEKQIYTFQDGYLFQESTQRLFNYKGSSAPFYTCVYPTSIFTDQKLKKEYYPFLPEAERFEELKKLSDNKYVVVVHDKNDSRYTSDWVKQRNVQSGSFSKVTKKDEIINKKQEILNEFGIIL